MEISLFQNFLRQGFSLFPWQFCSNLLCRPDWPWTNRNQPASAGIYGMCHHHPVEISFKMSTKLFSFVVQLSSLWNQITKETKSHCEKWKVMLGVSMLLIALWGDRDKRIHMRVRPAWSSSKFIKTKSHYCGSYLYSQDVGGWGRRNTRSSKSARV